MRKLVVAVLGVTLAFPLGIIAALTCAVSLFGSIIPISIFLGLVLPFIIPLIVFAAVVLVLALIIRATLRILIGLTRALLRLPHVAYMGIYGAIVLARAPRQRPRLFIPIPYPQSPPQSSPTLTDSTDSSFLRTPVDEQFPDYPNHQKLHSS